MRADFFGSRGLPSAVSPAVYAAALGLGVLSHIPGGLGVFEIAILYAVGSKAPVSAVAAALVAYRAIYYLLPLFLSTILLAGIEARRFLGANTGQRIGRAAGRLAPPFVATATFAVGATLVTSGAMPSFTERLQLVALHVPLWAVETAHLLRQIAARGGRGAAPFPQAKAPVGTTGGNCSSFRDETRRRFTPIRADPRRVRNGRRRQGRAEETRCASSAKAPRRQRLALKSP